MTAPYAWLSDIREVMSAGPDSQTVEDDILMKMASQASRRIDNLFHARRPIFLPYKESRTYLVQPSVVNSNDNTLSVPGNLLEATTVTAGGTALTAYEGWPIGISPSKSLRLTGECSQGWYQYQPCCTPYQVVVDGIWGFNSDYAYAWEAIDTLAGALNDSATTFTPTDVDAYSVGQLIRVDDEFMEVTAVLDAVTDSITVKRGVNGTTKASHLNGAEVEVWLVEEPIRRAVSRQTAFMYARRGAYENATITDLGAIQFPADLLAEVYGVMQGYAYL